MTRTSRLLLAALCALILALVIRMPVPAAARPASEDGHNIAVCATLLIVDELMDSDRFAPAREELQRVKQEQIQPLMDEMASLQNQFHAAQAAGEDLSAIQQHGQALQKQIAQAREQANREMTDLATKQIGECYDLIKASAEAVAKELGYDYVVSSSRADDDMQSNSSSEFLARPMLVYPEDADITEEVREDLKLE